MCISGNVNPPPFLHYTRFDMTLDEEFLVFTSLIGEAITSWALVERGLNDVVVSFVNNDDRDSISIGFFKLEGFKAKLIFADGVVTSKLAAEHFEDWTRLVKRLDTKSKSRNRIAHFPVGMDGQEDAGRRVTLRPWTILAPVNPKDRPPQRTIIVASDLLKIVEEFVALSNALENFAARVRGQPEPHPKSAEQATHQMTIQTRLRRIHAELGHPRQSLREKRIRESAENAAASLRNPIKGNPDE
jgi:hypothetical protein